MRFSRRTIELIQQLRKPVLAELGEQLLLADPLLLPKLRRVAARTRDPEVRRAIAEVLSLAGEAAAPLPPDAAAGQPRKVYRGCVVD